MTLCEAVMGVNVGSQMGRRSRFEVFLSPKNAKPHKSRRRVHGQPSNITLTRMIQAVVCEILSLPRFWKRRELLKQALPDMRQTITKDRTSTYPRLNSFQWASIFNFK